MVNLLNIKQDLWLFFQNSHNEPSQTDEDIDLSLLNEDIDDTPKPFEHKDLKPKFSFNPQLLNCLDHVYELILTEFLDYNPSNRYHRDLTRGQRNALNTLKSNKNIVIKKGDKGSNVVIMDTDKYISRVEDQPIF